MTMTTVEFCAKCGAILALVGKAHRCVPRADAPVPSPNASPNNHAAAGSTHGHMATARSRPAESEYYRGDAASSYARNVRWRAKHRDRYNAGMRNLMRRRRAAVREVRAG